MDRYDNALPDAKASIELYQLMKKNIGLFAFNKSEFGLTDVL